MFGLALGFVLAWETQRRMARAQEVPVTDLHEAKVIKLPAEARK